MLTEKEIKEIERIIGASFGAAFPEKVAAAAIAKRLSEGVVFKDTGECHGLTYGADGERMRVVNTDKMQLNMYEMLEDIPDGQLVSVTVKIVEGK